MNNFSSRKRVKNSLSFKGLDRIPRDLWASPYISIFQEEDYNSVIEKYPMDIEIAQSSQVTNNEKTRLMSKIGHYKDEWGSVWYIGEPGVVGEVKEPVLSDWSTFSKFKPPYDLLSKREFSHVEKLYERNEKFIISDVTARPFERLQFLRGTQNLFLDIASDEPKFNKLLKIVHEFYLKDIEDWCKTSVDAVFFMDDWGTNRSLLIDPSKWRETFKPLYQEYCDIIHSYKKFAFFHSDGNIEQIFGDLIEVGIDAINSQLFVMDIEELGKRFRGKITFWGEIDRQHILPFGTEEDVYNSVRRVRDNLYNGRGGIIAHCEWGKFNPIENIKAVYDAWDNKIDT